MEVEDLLQKHKLMEADIAIQGDKVKAINTATLQFTEGKGENLGVSIRSQGSPNSDSALWYPSLINLSFRIPPPSLANGARKKPKG